MKEVTYIDDMYRVRDILRVLRHDAVYVGVTVYEVKKADD